MENKNIIGIGILLVVLVLLGGVLYNIYFVEKTFKEKEDDTVETEYDNLNLEYDYKGENTWQYKITGTLPNPCYTIKTEAIVMESYPEQVIIKSLVTPPEADVVCIEVIQEVYQEGEFEASEFATVSFKVE